MASGQGNQPQPQAHLVFQNWNHTRTGLCFRMASPSVEVGGGCGCRSRGTVSHHTRTTILRAHFYWVNDAHAFLLTRT